MEIVTLEYIQKFNDKKEGIVLYFKDKESAERYKKMNLENDQNIILEDDCIGYQYYNDDDWYNEMNELIVDSAWARLNPSMPEAERVVERVVERIVEPDFYKVRYVNHNNMNVCKLLRSEDEMKDYMVKAIAVAVGPVTVIRMSLDQLVEAYENA